MSLQGPALGRTPGAAEGLGQGSARPVLAPMLRLTTWAQGPS